MKKTAYSIEFIKVAQISGGQVYSDVLERIAGYEEFVDANEAIGDKVFSVDKLNQILTDEEDDTNETTKLRIEELYEQIKDFDYFMITKL